MRIITIILISISQQANAQWVEFDSIMKGDIVDLIKMIETSNGFSDFEIRTIQDSILYTKGKPLANYKLKYINDEHLTFVTFRQKNITKERVSYVVKTSSAYIIASNGNEYREICNYDDLTWLIGEIDNIYEAILIAKLNGFSSIPFKNETKMNKYKLRKGHYTLVMVKKESCPEFGDIIEPKFAYKIVRLKISKSGIKKIIYREVYQDDCQ